MYNYKEETTPSTRPCAADGCTAKGEHRAPKNREAQCQSLEDYHWFCLDHVREYNKGWNYFDGMSREEIEHFQKEAVTGHRPTWRFHIPPHLAEEGLHQKIDELYGEAEGSGQRRRKEETPSIPQKDRRALEILELSHPTSHAEIKRSYKKLVKRYHPDAHRAREGSAACPVEAKEVEEKFKDITHSYKYLLDNYPDTQ